MGRGTLTWTPERNERLAELHRSGASIGTVAREVGVSERAAKSQLSALGLLRDKPKALLMTCDSLGVIALCRDPLLWRPKTCQYIEGRPEANDACKCGKPVLENSSYCAKHDVICWRERAA